MNIVDVNICNLGFAKVGHKSRLTSLNSDNRTVEADIARTFYEMTKNEMLGSFDWWFCRSLVPLSPEALVFEDWSYSYSIPSEAFVPRYLSKPKKTDPPIPYQLMREYNTEKMLLFTDQPSDYLVATTLLENPTRFTPLFVDALSWKLGHVFGPSIGTSVDRMSYAFKRYQEAAQLAMIDAANSESNAEANIEPSWLTSR